MVEIGDGAPPGGGIDKRTLLIGAVLLGGAIGAFVLFSRKSQPSASAENKEQTADGDTLGLAYQNLATQLLGFRGDVSVANASMAQGQQDILSAVGDESASRAASDQRLWQQLLFNLNYAADSRKLSNGGLVTLFNAIGYQTPYNSDDTDFSHPTFEQSGDGIRPVEDTSSQPGAGGATPRDSILAAFNADDDSHYYLARMSSGPVRQLTSRAY